MATYKEAGVNIDAGNQLVDRIRPLAGATKRTGMMEQLGGFGGLFDLKACGYNDPVLVSATDGVGTKLKLAIDTGIHDTVGIDLVAMCVNDLVVQGAEPLFFLDYFATGALELDQAEAVIKGIAKGCQQAGCLLIGGETAEMPGMYAKGDYDLAGFSVGAVERDGMLPRMGGMQAGDVLIGLRSSGVHSNGFSLVRHILKQKNLSFNDTIGDLPGATIGEWLLKPTRIYVKPCLEAIAGGGIKGLSHITGGGLLENIPRVLPKTLGADIDKSAIPSLPVFDWLKEAGNIADEEMWRTFNSGIGMVLIADPADADKLIDTLNNAGESAVRLGELVERAGGGVHIG